MKIIETDNFGGDYPNESFVTSLPQMNRDQAQRIADAINTIGGDYSSRYYKVVDDNYVLQPGFEP